MAQEEWRDVVGYEGYYQVSSFGRVRSLDRVLKNGRHLNGRYKKVTICKIGYPVVRLCKDGVEKNEYVHRLIAESFIPNPERLTQVDHINGIKSDSTLENLRWCTKSDNYIYAMNLGLIDIDEKIKVLNKKETRDKQRKSAMKSIVRNDGKVYESLKSAASDIGCNPHSISRVLRGQRHSIFGYTFTYNTVESENGCEKETSH